MYRDRMPPEARCAWISRRRCCAPDGYSGLARQRADSIKACCQRSIFSCAASVLTAQCRLISVARRRMLASGRQCLRNKRWRWRNAMKALRRCGAVVHAWYRCRPMSFASTDRHAPARDTAAATHAWSWGTSWRQRLRLLPLYLSICGAERLSGSFRRAHAQPRALPAWRPGLSVIIPERDAPQMLLQALQSLSDALAAVDEPRQVIVVANGAPRETYAEIMARFPAVELVHRRGALGFSAAIRLGLRRARYDWAFLMNNDITLDRDTLRQLARCRDADVFAVAAQIMQESTSGRREETGFTDWYADETGVRVFHADPGGEAAVRDHLCASGGAALFRARLLRRYVRDSRCYDPFYWEDVEWGVRAWQDGWRVRFCGAARVWHRRRATTARFYAEPELARIVERNRILFDARNAVSDRPPAWLLNRVCDLPYESQ